MGFGGESARARIRVAARRMEHRQDLMGIWREQLSQFSAGHITIVALSPPFEEWLERHLGLFTFHLTQVLIGQTTVLFRWVPLSNSAGGHARVSSLCEAPVGHGGAYSGLPCLGGAPPCTRIDSVSHLMISHTKKAGIIIGSVFFYREI